MYKIAIAGGPGSGKSSLARQLTTEFYNRQGRNAQLVLEFARDYISECRREQDGQFSPTMADQLLIYHTQARREAMVPAVADLMITDSPTFLSLVFASKLVNFAAYQDRTIYLHLYEHWLATYGQKGYDLIFLVRREKAFLADGTRGESPEQADAVGRTIEAFLNFHQVPYHVVSGTDDERLAQAKAVIREPLERMLQLSTVLRPST